MANQQYDERFPILEESRRQEIGNELAVIALQVGQLVEDFSLIERIPRYADGRRENDVEHSFMLAMAAAEMAQGLGLNLDTDKIRSFAIVHDLLELKIGDVATFDLNKAQEAEKERLTLIAKNSLYSELPTHIAQDLEEYERQDTSEAIFVRMVDKLLPVVVDITGDGVRIMQEDYSVGSFELLQQAHAALHARIAKKFADDFPDLVAAHAILCQLFEDKYLKTAATMEADERPRNPTEIELKYVIDLDKLPKDIDLANVKKKRLQQGYIAIGKDGSETRVRNTDNEKFELTTKSPGMIARDEQTIRLTKEMFDGLWAQAAGRQVTKVRHYIPLDAMTIELDIYEGHLQGLVTAEVEFDGRPAEAIIRATTFEPPAWFGRDVSEDTRYKNQNLAQEFPHDPIPLGAKQF